MSPMIVFAGHLLWLAAMQGWLECWKITAGTPAFFMLRMKIDNLIQKDEAP